MDRGVQLTKLGTVKVTFQAMDGEPFTVEMSASQTESLIGNLQDALAHRARQADWGKAILDIQRQESVT